MENIQEGLFSADRNEIKLYGNSKEDLQSKIQTYQDKYKDYQPKVGNIKANRSGRFVTVFSYLVNDKNNKEDIFSKIGRGYDKTKQVINKTKQVVQNIADKIPRQGKLTAENGFQLGQEQAKFVKDHPDVKFGTKYKNSDGTWSIDYSALKTPTKKCDLK